MYPGPARFPRSIPAAVWGIALLCAVPELVLTGADWGLWGSARWRPLAYQNGAFWAGLLQGWRPNYAWQPTMMFASYGWLHIGPGHLAGNLLALAWLGPQVLARTGARGFLLLWTAGLLGGAAAFGLLTSSPAPMIGASGALFGLAGAWSVNDLRRLQGTAARLLRGLLLLALFAALNAAVWVLQNGHLAWETHLGGMVAGGMFAGLWRSEPDRFRPW